MIGEEASLLIILRARDEAKAVLGEAEGSLGGIAKAAGALALVGGAALIGIAAHSVKMAADFQAATTLIHTQAGAIDEDLGKIRTALLQMAGEVGRAPTELAEGLYHIESAGFRGAKALDMLRQAAELATIGQANFEDTTQAIVGTMAAFEHSGMTAAQAAAQLNAIVGVGDMRMQQLAKAIATGILPTAATFGLKLTDVGAALATLTDNVTPADEAATRLRMTFSMLGAPTGAAQKALSAIGLDATTLANDMRKPNGLLLAITDLRSHLSHIDVSHFAGGVAQAKAELEHFGLTSGEANQALSKLGPSATEQAIILARAFGGGRSSAAIMTLLTEFDRLQQKYKDIAKGAQGFGAAWEETQKNFNFHMAQFKAGVDAAEISMGMRLLPAVTNLISAITPALPTIANLAAALATGMVNAVMLVIAAIRILITVVQSIVGFIQQWHTVLLVVAAFITTVMLPTIIALTVQGVVSAYQSVILWTMYTWENIAAHTASAARLVAANVVIIARTVAVVATTVATWLWTAATTALGVAMTIAGGPIGFIIIVVAALAAGVIYAYTHFGWFRNAVNAAAAAIGSFIGWIGNAIGAVARFISPIVDAISKNDGLRIALLAMLGPVGIAIALFTHLGDIIRGIAGFISNVTGAVGNLSNALSNIHLPNISLPHFQSGGFVPGSGPLPIIAHGGELILNPQQQAALFRSSGAVPTMQTIVLQLDGREVTRVVLRHMEDTRRLKGGWLGTGA